MKILSPLLFALVLVACTSTPPILDPQGRVEPQSLAVLEPVVLNGRTEWITIRGRDRSRPLLLFLAGGPGCSELVQIREILGGLEDHYVVVNWDQPGAGKSYAAVDHRQLSVDVYLDDACALVDQLLQRFNRPRVILVGESWGSYLAIRAAQRMPTKVSAVVGTGQMVAFLENDLTCYRWALDWARSQNRKDKVEALEKQGPPPYRGGGIAPRMAEFLGLTFEFMREEAGVRTGNTFRDLAGSEYSPLDRINWFRGLWDTLECFYPQLWERDLRTEAPQLEVPVFFFVGRHDINASIPLLEDYFEDLKAPRKQIVWFERSGHTPWSSEPERFIQELNRMTSDISVQEP